MGRAFPYPMRLIRSQMVWAAAVARPVACAICGSTIPAYIIERIPIMPDDPLIIEAARESGSKVRHWPDDAPLW